jgi:hypothetical protein
MIINVHQGGSTVCCDTIINERSIIVVPRWRNRLARRTYKAVFGVLHELCGGCEFDPHPGQSRFCISLEQVDLINLSGNCRIQAPG